MRRIDTFRTTLPCGLVGNAVSGELGTCEMGEHLPASKLENVKL